VSSLVQDLKVVTNELNFARLEGGVVFIGGFLRMLRLVLFFWTPGQVPSSMKSRDLITWSRCFSRSAIVMKVLCASF